MAYLTLLQNSTLALNIYVQPRASQNRIAGIHGNAVKLCVTAPPVENKANEAITGFIANLFEVPKSAVSIKSGRQGRNKKVIITNLTLSKAKGILDKALTNT